jgi:hypothetical protein
MKPTPTDIADAIAKCEAGPDPVSGERIIEMLGRTGFASCTIREGKRLCDGFDDTAGAAMAISLGGRSCPRWDADAGWHPRSHERGGMGPRDREAEEAEMI